MGLVDDIWVFEEIDFLFRYSFINSQEAMGSSRIERCMKMKCRWQKQTSEFINNQIYFFIISEVVAMVLVVLI
jgi:hypothetical protein